MEPQKSLVQVKTDIEDKVIAGFFGGLASVALFATSGAISYTFGMDKTTFDSLIGVYIAGTAGSGVFLSQYLHRGISKSMVQEILRKEHGKVLANPNFKAKRTFRTLETTVLTGNESQGQTADQVNLITNWKGVYLEYIKVPKPLEKWDQSMNTLKALYSIETKNKVLEKQTLIGKYHLGTGHKS